MDFLRCFFYSFFQQDERPKCLDIDLKDFLGKDRYFMFQQQQQKGCECNGKT